MPYRKTYGRTRRRFPYIRRFRKNYSSNRIRRIAQAVVESNIEVKGIVNNLNLTGITDQARTPVSTELTAIAQGDDIGNRTGRDIYMTGFYGRFVLAAQDPSNFVRVCILIAKNETYNPNTEITHLNYIDPARYTVLYDKIFTLEQYANKTIVIKKNWHKGKRKGIKCSYDGTTANDCTHNKMYFYMVSDSAAVADPYASGHVIQYYRDA